MLKPTFYHYQSFRETLGVNDETIRQALIRGELSAYLEPKNQTARLSYRSFCGGVAPNSGSNEHCSWRELPLPFEGADAHDYYLLTGWFRVEAESLKEAARNGEFRESPLVIPPAEQNGLLTDGDVFDFNIQVQREYDCTFYNGYDCDYLPSIKDLWFSRTLIESLQDEGVGVVEGVINSDKSKKIRGDREQNLLRVIAGLWALSGLPAEHNVTADKLSGLFDSWGWDKPVAGTMADTILRQAANIPGAIIRK